MGDDFVSVEHLVLAFHSDPRFGKQLFQNFNLDEKELKASIQAVRGSQKVTDQSKVFFSFEIIVCIRYMFPVIV